MSGSERANIPLRCSWAEQVIRKKGRRCGQKGQLAQTLGLLPLLTPTALWQPLLSLRSLRGQTEATVWWIYVCLCIFSFESVSGRVCAFSRRFTHSPVGGLEECVCSRQKAFLPRAPSHQHSVLHRPATSAGDRRCVLLTFLAARGQKNLTSRCSGKTGSSCTGVMFTFVTNTVSFRWMKRSCWGYLLGEILKQTLCGLFRSAGDNQAAVTSARWLKCFHGSVKKKKKKKKTWCNDI